MRDPSRADSQRQFTISYLIALLFWWAVVFATSRQFFVAVNTLNYHAEWFIATGLALCPAIGGLFLKMRFGLLLGAVLAVLVAGFRMWAFVWKGV